MRFYVQKSLAGTYFITDEYDVIWARQIDGVERAAYIRNAMELYGTLHDTISEMVRTKG